MVKQQDEVPLYATLLYGVRKQLGITITEYYYVDMVYHLSRNERGWCYKSLDLIAEDMGMHKNGVIKLRDRMIARGLIKKSIKGYVRTTDMYHSVVRSGGIAYHSVSSRTTQCDANVPLSGTKNNNRITKKYIRPVENSTRPEETRTIIQAMRQRLARES